jgi:predicted RNA-binding protein with PIN domain
MSTQADWTWLVYMAGDNNLEGAGKEDLDEMKEVGSSSELNIIVQFDTEDKTSKQNKINLCMSQ